MESKGLAFFSGGKDSVFSIMKAKESGINIDYLLFNTHDFPRPNIHEINQNVVEAIASLIGIPLYKLHLKSGLEYIQLYEFLSSRNIEWIVVGNINAKDQLNWYMNLCNKIGVKLHAPLYSEEEDNRIILEEIKAGIKAIICDLDISKLNRNMLGRIIDMEIINDLAQVGFCGEMGEYHTLVLESPIMKGKIVPKKCKIIEKWNRRMLKIEEFDLVRFYDR
ncbi:MAG: hypothetical protein NZ922_00740 [Candidatus Methanomethyliaceae archaeon]|nr:hypothetical protein [Candidatus Methanomethyliaceae archaeon]MDW7970294.1 hypothetical protein [Nitrososphaerota archaeon]